MTAWLLILHFIAFQSADVLPLQTGSYWIYRGTVKWTVPNSNTVREQVLDWKMEVVRSVRVGRYDVAVMKGHPGDLAWYEPGKARGDYLIVRDEGRYYKAENRVEDLQSLLSDAARLESLLKPEILFLELPLEDGKCFGRDPADQRIDLMYCWAVRRESAAFQLAYRSNPDHTIVTYTPGVGITQYIYGHHGTVSDADVKLVEHRVGR